MLWLGIADAQERFLGRGRACLRARLVRRSPWLRPCAASDACERLRVALGSRGTARHSGLHGQQGICFGTGLRGGASVACDHRQALPRAVLAAEGPSGDPVPS
jgi:hypothetical protein